MIQQDLIQTAIESLRNLSQGKIQIQVGNHTNGKKWDAQMAINAGDAKGTYNVEVINHVSSTILLRIKDKLLGGNSLIVARNITASNQELLERWGINYLDVAGNCLIQSNNGLYIRIQGEAMPIEFKVIKHKAFNPNGIKLIYALLLQPTLVNEPYRKIAFTAGISLSTIGVLLEDLKATKFLEQVTKDTRQLTRKVEMLSKWITAYQQKLRPKKFRGKYRFISGVSNWEDIDLRNKAWWGGEPAASLLSNALTPGIWTLYTDHDRSSLLDDFGLIPDPKNGNVEVFSTFWREEEEPFIFHKLKIVNPLLVYTDLMISGENRNIEIAKRIYEQYITNIIE